MSSNMRDALEEVESILSTWIDHLPPVIQEKAHEAIDKAEAALAEPVRNCEVGTEEEQAHRFHDFCIGNSSSIDGMCDPKCPCIASPDKCHCLCKWLQMPYEKGESNG